MEDSHPRNLRDHLPSWPFLGLTALVLLVAATVFVWSGVYNVGADRPHTKPVFWVLDTLRNRSIATNARGIKVPIDLKDPNRVAAGAGLYAEMCTSCHLAPGMEKTELSQGLYPAAPELRQGSDHPPTEEFWIIKHGLKMTAMPAWGRTHSDDLMWDMVAFLQTLPKLSPAQYQDAVSRAPKDHDQMMKDAGPQGRAEAVNSRSGQSWNTAGRAGGFCNVRRELAAAS